MTSWGWQLDHYRGIWRHGPGWLRPLVAAMPWITVILLLQMLVLVGGTLTTAKGVLFDLPEVGLAEGVPTSMVALALPKGQETLVFFDDSRYTLGDEASEAALGSHLSSRAAKSENGTLLVLADRRISGGELMKLASLARRGGVGRILFAEKRPEARRP